MGYIICVPWLKIRLCKRLSQTVQYVVILLCVYELRAYNIKAIGSNKSNDTTAHVLHVQRGRVLYNGDDIF